MGEAARNGLGCFSTYVFCWASGKALVFRVCVWGFGSAAPPTRNILADQTPPCPKPYKPCATSLPSPCQKHIGCWLYVGNGIPKSPQYCFFVFSRIPCICSFPLFPAYNQPPIPKPPASIHFVFHLLFKFDFPLPYQQKIQA